MEKYLKNIHIGITVDTPNGLMVIKLEMQAIKISCNKELKEVVNFVEI